jgi:hypothetical protein
MGSILQMKKLGLDKLNNFLIIIRCQEAAPTARRPEAKCAVST